MKIKICGITNLEDAMESARLGAYKLGFIFAESTRKVSVDSVREILQGLEKNNPRNKIRTVGVFVNEDFKKIKEILRETGLDYAQLHGDESPQQIKDADFACYKALRIASIEDFDRQCPDSGNQWKGPILLFDTAVKGTYGGTGKTIDVKAAEYACNAVKKTGKEFFLAGGINPENVRGLIKSIRPDGIDVGSGVEESPGKKSFKKLAELFNAVSLGDDKYF